MNNKVELSVSKGTIIEILSDYPESPSESIPSPLKKTINISDELNNAVKKATFPRVPIQCDTLSGKIQIEV